MPIPVRIVGKGQAATVVGVSWNIVMTRLFTRSMNRLDRVHGSRMPISLSTSFAKTRKCAFLLFNGIKKFDSSPVVYLLLLPASIYIGVLIPYIVVRTRTAAN